MTEQTNDDVEQETTENEAENTIEQPAGSSAADDSEVDTEPLLRGAGRRPVSPARSGSGEI